MRPPTKRKGLLQSCKFGSEGHHKGDWFFGLDSTVRPALDGLNLGDLGSSDFEGVSFDDRFDS